VNTLLIRALYIVCAACLLGVGMLSVSRVAQAQFSLFNAGVGIDMTLSIIPENPTPNSTVFAQVESFSVDADRLPITWFVDGIEVLRGTGETEIEFSVGDLGETTTVQVIVRQETGQTITRTQNITPGSVDVLWESTDGYRPPFYKGKVLPVRESTLKFVAIPQVQQRGALTSPKQFEYTWEHDFSVQGSQSGFGQDSFTVINSSLSPSETVGVQATSLDGSQIAEKRITVPLTDPEIVIYTKTDEGRSRLAVIQEELVRENDISLVAEPYNFSVVDNDPRVLRYEWRSGTQVFQNPNGGDLLNELQLQNSGEEGILNLSVTAEHPLNLFQLASNVFRLSFRQ
jgi:hypothetical protein